MIRIISVLASICLFSIQAIAAPTGASNSVWRMGSSGLRPAFGTVNIASSAAVTGVLPVANGGTGAAALTSNNVLLGNGASTPQVVAPSTNGNVLTSNGTTWISQAPTTIRNEIWLQGNNGHGTGTPNGGGAGGPNIRRYPTITSSTGTGITYTDSATNGGSFTVNSAGVYSIDLCDDSSASALGITVNDTQLSTNINAVTASHILSAANASDICITATKILNANDVIRAHDNGTYNGSGVGFETFRIVQISN